MHWHHQGTRTVAAGFAVPYLRPELAKALGADGLAKAKRTALDALQLLETHWFGLGLGLGLGLGTLTLTLTLTNWLQKVAFCQMSFVIV